MVHGDYQMLQEGSPDDLLPFGGGDRLSAKRHTRTTERRFPATARVSFDL